ncbi:MAG: Rieske 2Fe-2S domain-containing protein [Sterolibacteriaceae bacterium]|jgi:nitrite reductase/ring-hydroxylating ferredoxin subunit|nr:Rieske 2Fe-2S domain-containing protein [Sterolibacteriaceae bacterium]MBK9084360.1 Rieske 2Fe-2S domain-containing protein [Sterolibacteriaceae bacterium]
MDKSVRICSSTEVVERGQGHRFELRQAGESAPAFVVRYNGRARAFFNRCAHVSVELDWELGQFFDPTRVYLICSTHGAIYEPDSGRCIAGPCKGARLSAIAVQELDGWIFLEGPTA